MTIDELRSLTEHALGFAMKIIAEGREFAPMAILARNDGGLDIVGIDPEFMRNGGTKGELSQILRQKVNDGTVHAIVFLSDMWVTRLSVDDPVLISICRRIGSEKAAELGFVKRHEAILANLDSPIYRQSISQTYERKDGRVFFGERRMCDDTSSNFHVEGRFSNFFTHENGVKA